MLQSRGLMIILGALLFLITFFFVYSYFVFIKKEKMDDIKEISMKIEKIRNENLQFEKEIYKKKFDKKWIKENYLKKGYKKINLSTIPTVIFTNNSKK